LERYIADFVHDLPAPPASIGIAVPGLVDVDFGRVRMSDVLPRLDGWRPDSLLGPYARHVLVNDARAALAESCRDRPPGSTAAILVAGTAIGMAWMADGRVVNGATGWAGELGSMPVPGPDGVRRLDEFAGGAAIVAGAGMPPADIHRALAAGDRRVRAVVRAAGESFGLAIATVINMINPQVVTLAGGTLRYAGYLDTALEAAERTALPELWCVCTVRRAADESRIVALGALHLAEAATSTPTAGQATGEQPPDGTW
jgi:predicted NBD/HSP70 family sugar kinase